MEVANSRRLWLARATILQVILNAYLEILMYGPLDVIL